MKKNHIVFKCAYLFLMLFLFFIGYQNMEISNTMTYGGQEEIRIGTESERIKQELEGTQCPQNPEEKGVTIERSKDIKIPEDAILENWRVYEFQEGETITEERAEQVGKVLLGDYFSKAEKKIEDYKYFGYYFLDYRDKEVNYHLKAMLKGAEITFAHRNLIKQELEEPEDGNWENRYLQKDKELLQELELGIWDGKQGYLELVESESKQLRNISRHVYKYKIDNKVLSNANFNFIYNTTPYNTQAFPVTFEYQNGILTEFSVNEPNHKFKNIRDAKIKYSSIEEILEEAEKKIKMTLLLNTAVNSASYYYYRIEDVQFYYMRYCYGDLERKYAFVPMAEIKTTGYFYDIKKGEWSEIDNAYYGLQLETGEGNFGAKW